MKKENIERYEREFKYISDDQYERISDYITENNLSKKDMKKIHDKIKEHYELLNDTETLKIVFDIIPEATPRPRLGLHGVFYVKNSHSNNEFVRMMVSSDRDLYHFISTPCILRVDNYFPIPKVFSKADHILAELGIIEDISKPDWDNLGKTYSDMVQKWILHEDAYVIKGTSTKQYSLKPRVEVTLTYKKHHISKYNEKKVIQSTQKQK